MLKVPASTTEAADRPRVSCTGVPDEAADGRPAGPHGAAQAAGGKHSAQPDVRRGGRRRPRRRHARRRLRRAAGEALSSRARAFRSCALHILIGSHLARARAGTLGGSSPYSWLAELFGTYTCAFYDAPQADALEHALIAALPLGPQSAAGGVSLPDSFIVRASPASLDVQIFAAWRPGAAAD